MICLDGMWSAWVRALMPVTVGFFASTQRLAIRLDECFAGIQVEGGTVPTRTGERRVMKLTLESSRDEHLISPRHVVDLVRMVGILALSADKQVSVLRGLGVYPMLDELALGFADYALLAPQAVALNWLSEPEAAIVGELESLLSGMSASADKLVWHADAIERKEWQAVRECAASFFQANDDR